MSEHSEARNRNLANSIGRGVRSRCPNCGEGGLFGGFLQVAERCPNCGEAFHHHRADDAPAYLTILVVGHLMLPLILAVEEFLEPALWVHLLLWGTLIPAACLLLLRPMKGAIVGLQWATRMHGFGEGRTGADS